MGEIRIIPPGASASQQGPRVRTAAAYVENMANKRMGERGAVDT